MPKTACALLTLLIAVGAGCEKKEHAVTVREAETLSPRDLGVGKYVLEATPRVGQVMVVRFTETVVGEKPKRVSEVIHHTNGGPAKDVILVYDSSEFPFGDGKPDVVRVKANGGSGGYRGCSVTKSSLSPGRLALELTGEGRDTVVLTYEAFVEDYEKTKARIPKLPALSPKETWTYNTTIKSE